MQQNAGLLTQHVSSIIMPIFRSTLLSTAFWCPNGHTNIKLYLFLRFVEMLLVGFKMVTFLNVNLISTVNQRTTASEVLHFVDNS
jgi:hypothetical protein